MLDCPLAAVLTTAADRLGRPDLAEAAAGLTAPVRVLVRGAPGAGVRTAVRVLRAIGVSICGPDEQADLEVRVVAEPSADRAGRADLMVLTKTDLIGPGEALRRCREIRRRTGVSTVGLSALAAVAAFDPAVADDDLAVLADRMAVASPGADRAAMRTVLRRASGLDGVSAAIAAAAAPVRYRRVDTALTALAARATGPDGVRLAVFLSGDDVVLSRMLAAAEVVRQAGLPVPSVPADPLAAAIRWRRYAAGPVSDLHRACAGDLTRGALRLWDRSSRLTGIRSAVVRPVVARRVGLRQARMEAALAVRASCATLRAELLAGAGEVSRAEDFVRRARDRIAEVAAGIDADMTTRLAAVAADPAGWPDPPAVPEEPPLRASALESRLAALLGLTFGAGAALTLGRVLADLLSRWSGAVWPGCALLGLFLGLWVVRTRRTISERAAAERWAAESVASLRSAMEDRVAARFAVAEFTLLTSAPFGGSPRPGSDILQ